MEEIAFKEGDSKGFEALCKDQMEKPIKHYEKDLGSIRTGRASIAMLENIMVESYGQIMPLKEVASLGAPEPRLLTIQPWDKSIINEIEKAVIQSDLGATPVNDGNLIRVPLPQMSTARREEFVKILGKKTEDCKVAVRNIRKDFHNEVRDAQRKKIISEDFAKKLSESLQKVTDVFIERVDKVHEKKAAEITSL